MEVSQIKFCNKTAFNMKNNREKKTILDELNSKFNIDFLKKNFIFSNKLTNLLMTNKFLCTYITQGNRYLLYLTRFHNENYSILIDTKLTNDHIQPKILIIQLSFSDKFYETNTLLTGELVILFNNSYEFIIDDILVYKNRNQEDKNILEKLPILYDMLENHYFYDKNLHLCKLSVKKFYNIKDLEFEYENTIKNFNFKSNGFLFTPINTKLPKIEYNFFKNNHNYNTNNQNNTSKNNHLNQKNINKSNTYKNSLNSNRTHFTKVIPSKVESNLLTFEIKSGNAPNIYYLYCYYEKTLNKHSIARIDTLECSEFVNDLLLNKDSEIIYCEFSNRFKKWIPKSKSNNQISNIKDIDNYLIANNNI